MSFKSFIFVRAPLGNSSPRKCDVTNNRILRIIARPTMDTTPNSGPVASCTRFSASCCETLQRPGWLDSFGSPARHRARRDAGKFSRDRILRMIRRPSLGARGLAIGCRHARPGRNIVSRTLSSGLDARANGCFISHLSTGSFGKEKVPESPIAAPKASSTHDRAAAGTAPTSIPPHSTKLRAPYGNSPGGNRCRRLHVRVLPAGLNPRTLRKTTR
jgi:hypothetical protein